MKKIKAPVLTVVILTLVGSVSAQNHCVKVKFEVDGKEVDQKFRVLLYFDNKILEPTVVGNSFISPAELKDQEKVNVRFLSGGYDLSFESVYVTKFNTDWVVG